ncbi:endoplasmic reticulum aminopeptidase 1-like [Acipenser ruthenus]|uniref:endoplasmic reticulum aminopeptidase 1-like n=1 Tax=Acipenser ruthenus TaxID=7906 RepID=UPI0027425241|nr:endoplasmic reticulum aminopeptidase 1-like [Acipenser ruthenus]XP_058886811.1 endoplasmic reticulum aminopeptidase 1-like [Acipenser ruthenus]XP_058886877.1 endoplasmic reticulum aminopeptidase 1-like [Acipenser ruthenus]XP_058886941.1 endoplasmic reticulum aminopeptidase 1-like [Acipenser ruthenus]
MQSRLRGTSLRRHLLAAALLVALTAQCSASAGQGEESSSETISLLATNGQPFPWNKMRLPSSVSPLHYDLLIHPNLTTLDFTGSVKITVEVKEDTGFVVLHSKHLQISKAVIQQGGGGTSPLQVLEYPAYEQVALLSATPLVTNRLYVISIEYAANLSESFHGFYKSTYRTQEGEVRVLASTQFEPTAARLAFPCFDEPAFKANFSIKIRREAKHIALSNMPLVKSEALGGGLLEDHFDMSVKMSTYLVAFIVSDFVSVSKMSDNGVKISVYAVPEKIDQAHFALEAAAKLLDFYEDYFKIPYPLPKQDLAAIPDFQSGAMENWGLTTYRESALLFNPKTSSASEKLGITMIIAHELAHQWFGNLVTMEWWNDLWLNEGFAKFMEYVSVNITNPELQVEDYFLGQCFNAMEVDALSSSHPISTPVQNPAQIQEMFDDVSYAKGACILNMLRDFLTADAFKIGIIRYLRRYSYENTRNEHLWESLTNICQSDDLDEGRLQGDGFCAGNQQLSATAKWYMHDELDVKTMMNTWTLQQGFPLISVSVRGREVRLSQERYLKGSDPSQSSQYLWHIPLTYITSNSNTVHRFLLKTKNDVLFLPEEVEWIKFNVGMNGYYIVHYEGEGWDALINLLQKNHTALSSNDRASLLNNAFQLVSIGKLPLDKALDLTLYLKHETEIMPVTQGLSELIPLYKLMEKRDMSDVENKMKGYIVQLFRELIDRQTWSDEGSVSQRMLRSYLLMFACVRGYQPCVDKAERLFQEWKESDGNLSLPSDVVLAVYSVGAQTPEGWDFLFEQYRRSLFSAVKSQIKSALTISRMPHKLQWIMEQSLQGDTMKTQDLPYVVVYVSKNPAGHKHAWEFLKTNWHTLVKKFDLGSHSIAHMVTGVTNQYSTREMLEEVRGFFEALEESGSQLRCVQQAVESIEENIRWMDKNLDKVKGWLQRNHL